MKFWPVIFLLPCSLFLMGCETHKHNAAPKSLESVERKISSQPVNDFQLGFAKREGIAHVVFEDSVTPREEPETTYQFIRVEFPNLSKENYQKLMTRYGGRGLVPWQEGRAIPYELEDFLHPKIQALTGRWLKSTVEPADSLPVSWRTFMEGEPLVTTISNDMNCWNASYEVLRDWFTPLAKMKGIIGYIDGATAADNLLNAKYMSVEDPFKAPTDLASFSIAHNKDREVGDLLFIHRFPAEMKMDAAHTALWIDDDLYFDKPNSGDTLPFRIARSKEVVENYLGREMRFARIKKDAPPMPSQVEIALEEEKGMEPLPSAYKGHITTSNVLSIGGGTSGIGLNRLIEFPVKQNAESMRAEFVGADKMLNFIPGEALCWSHPDSTGKFKYMLSKNLTLHVRDSKGRDVVKLNANKIQANKQQVDFISGTGNVLKLTSQGEYPSEEVYVDHPGNGAKNALMCARSLQALLSAFPAK